MKTETIIEAAEKLYPIYDSTSEIDREHLMNLRRQFEKGAKWHEEKYAETGIGLIAQERIRQISQEGWTPKHDNQHASGQLATAGAIYALPEHRRQIVIFHEGGKGADIINNGLKWPWSLEWWKPSPDNRIRELQKAGALIAAEIDRLINKGE